jgi:hypothetical protein
MVQRNGQVAGITTNKTVRKSCVTDEETLRGEMFFPECDVPYSLNKQKRWQIVDNNTVKDDKEPRKERVGENRNIKKKQFQEDLKNQKQTQEKRTPQKQPENTVSYEEPQSNKNEEDNEDGEWKIYQYRNKKQGKIPYPLTWNPCGSERTSPVVFIPPSKKTVMNHLNGHAGSYKDTYGKVTARDKRRQNKKEAREIIS